MAIQRTSLHLSLTPELGRFITPRVATNQLRSWVGWLRHITLAMLALAYLSVVRRSAEQGAAGGCGPGKPQPGPAAAHRARGQAVAGRTRARTTTQAPRRPALVNLATAAPAMRQTRALAPSNTGTHG